MEGFFQFILFVSCLISLCASQNFNPVLLQTIESEENQIISPDVGQKILSPVFDTNVITLENSVFKSSVNDISERFRKSVENMKHKNKKIDVIFLIDSSSSVGKSNFLSELKFVKKLLSDFDVSYNYTRVAIITFSSQAKVLRHVDQISISSEENDKCKLLNDDVPLINFVGGGTFTYGALKEAKEIFARSRPSSRKYIFLVTDGFSNGKDPVPMAAELKRENITIFTIGIQSGNSVELQNISSSPKESYNFLLDTFSQFESLARRALHSDYKSGNNLILQNSKRCSNLCDQNENGTTTPNGDCCDSKADCTCGVSSGHYACICQPGYYGSGLKEECYPCPNGTYWHFTRMCRPCPDINHITTDYPALSVDQCTCKSGFKKTKDNRCEGITCSKLLPPENGYFVKQPTSCMNVLNAACGARCKSGFQLIGTSLRLCQENGTWSGVDATCVLKTCPSLTVPYYGVLVCRNRDLNLFYDYSTRNDTFMEWYEDDSRRITEQMPIDTECTYKCGPGYYLVGSRTRNCLPLSKWDGLHTTCKQVLCSPLQKPTFGDYELSDCSETKTPFGTNCTLECPNGFSVKGPAVKTCGGKKVGVWSHKNKIPKCVDITPPSIVCPLDFNVTVGNEKFVIIKNMPSPLNVSDSSEMNTTFWLKPALNKTEGIKLVIGEHNFTYVASDSFANTAECAFLISVIDNTPPSVDNCVDPDVFYISTNPNAPQTDKLVEWDEPTFYDNSEMDVFVTKSLSPGYISPGSYQAVYTASDVFNNTRTCILNITVKEFQCEPLSSPLHGYSFCARNSSHTWCQISCNSGFAVFDEVDEKFVENYRLVCANEDPKWKYETVPDCTIVDLPNNIEQILTLSLESEEPFCNRKDLQEDLQNSLMQQIKSHLCENLEGCDIISEMPHCIEDEEPNEIAEKTYYNIIKRDINGLESKKSKPKTRSSVRIKLYTKIGKRLGIWERDESLSENVRKVKYELENINKNERLKQVLQDLRIDIKKLKIEELIRCPDGSISRKFLCMQCPRGTYQDAAYNRCQACPIGTYNEEVAQSNCKPCPLNFSTRRSGRQHISHCKELCPPGTVAKSKTPRRKARPGILNSNSLMPFCRKCNPGEYQPFYDETTCLPCPAGFLSSRGSKELEDCLPREIHPCYRNPTICGSFGRCVPDRSGGNLYSCICTEGYIGSHCEHKIDLCLSAPCYNNGICYYVNHTSIACQCSAQFTGKYCENLKNSCERIMCLNGGVCFETDDRAICECPQGFQGDFCEHQINYCNISPCEAGKCVNTPEGYQCQCPPGIIGKRCHLRPCDYFPCHRNAICIDLMHYPATRDSYMCKCPKGWKGFDCTQVHNPCDVKPCKSNGRCVPAALREPGRNSDNFDEDRFEEYSCICPPYFYGKNCDILTTPDFILRFPKHDINSYIELEGPQTDLKEISFCTWIQTDDGFNYGSILSYATEDNDNVVTFTDYSGFVLYINGAHAVTDMVVNDGRWHFICTAWSSRNGFYEIYLDGLLHQTGFNLSTNKDIPKNGVFIIGQEQDYIGGGFSESESFLGSIAYFDIWNNFITGREVQEFYSTCEPYQGNLYSWTDFKIAIHGNIQVEQSEFCHKCPTNLTITNGFVNIVDNAAFYKCKIGYKLQGNPVRYCLRTSQWSTNEPFCEIVTCNELPGIDNGYIEYTGVTYRGQAKHICDEGYILIGDTFRICFDDANWSGTAPQCSSKIKCKAIEVVQSAKILYLNNKGYLDRNLEEFPVGTFADITCIQNSQSIEASLVCTYDGNWDGKIPELCRRTVTSTTQRPAIETQSPARALQRNLTLFNTSQKPVQLITKATTTRPIVITPKETEATTTQKTITTARTLAQTTSHFTTTTISTTTTHLPITTRTTTQSTTRAISSKSTTPSIPTTVYTTTKVTTTPKIIATTATLPTMPKTTKAKPLTTTTTQKTTTTQRTTTTPRTSTTQMTSTTERTTTTQKAATTQRISTTQIGTTTEQTIPITSSTTKIPTTIGKHLTENPITQNSTDVEDFQTELPLTTAVNKIKNTDQATLPTKKLPDKNFWLNLKSYLFSGCPLYITERSEFCKYQKQNVQLRDLLTFDPPDSEEYQHMDVQLLNRLKKYFYNITEKDELPFEIFFDYILYGTETVEDNMRLSSKMEDSLRFVFCIFIDTIIWDQSNMPLSEGDESSTENITGKLKSFIVKLAVPVYANYLRRSLEQSSDEVSTSCNLQDSPYPPEHGIIVRIFDKVGGRYDIYTMREKISLAVPGTKIVYSCIQPYKSEGNYISECGINLLWTPIDYSCETIRCDRPPQPLNMHYSDGEEVLSVKHAAGVRLRLQCNEGYVVHGSAEIQCLTTGKWTRVLGRCTRISCNKPKLPDNAIIVSGRSYFFDDKLYVQCDNNQTTELTCQGDGSWHPQIIC